LNCIGRPAPRRQGEYIRDLIASPEVWDDAGYQVRIVEKEIQTYGEEIVPEITVEYNDSRCISFQ
jgi:hypothetical protein